MSGGRLQVIDPRGRLLMAAVEFADCSCLVRSSPLGARTWLDSWPGIGHVAVGMHRQATTFSGLSTMSAVGELLSTRRGWSTHPTSATGNAWERTPWHAVQRAVWAVLRRADGER